MRLEDARFVPPALAVAPHAKVVIENRDGVAHDLGLERQFLHACRLAFRHPITEAEIDLSSPLPADLERALARARVGER